MFDSRVCSAFGEKPEHTLVTSKVYAPAIIIYKEFVPEISSGSLGKKSEHTLIVLYKIILKLGVCFDGVTNDLQTRSGSIYEFSEL